jgi:tyrosine-protein kinase Etk/Wzc
MSTNNSEQVTEYKVLDFFLLLVKWKKIIALTVGSSIILGLILAFTVPRQYKSIARILPPKESNTLTALSGLSSLVRSLPGGIAKFGRAEDPYDFIALIRSRSVMEEIVRKFTLTQAYEISDNSMEKTLKELANNTEVDWTEENTMEIRVYDRDANRAADIANSYVELLNKRHYELQTQEAKNTRIFLQQRVEQNRLELTEAEKRLQSYQEKEKMMVPVDPSAAGISAIAEIYADKIKKEVELGILQRSVGEQHPHYRQTKLELDALNAKIATLPEIGITSLRLYRDVAIQQKIMELLIPLYEQAKVNEHKDVPVAYVLDYAVPGEKPDRPKRLFIVGIAVFLGILLSLVIISWKEYSTHLQLNSPERWAQLQSLKRVLHTFKD